MRLALAIASVLAIGGCATQPRPGIPADAAARVFYTYVVLGEEGRAIARAITEEASCPALEIDGATRPMAVRAPPVTIALRPTVSPPLMSRPSAFPVLTCEAAIPADATRAAIGGRALPLPKAQPQRIVIVGDTGCRMLAGEAFQACNDGAQWPFGAVANAAAAGAPDLVIHVGDFHYRESACPAGNAGCEGSPWGYGWDAWEADLFAPARKLMAAAPWIVVRGNHESCNRAGQGWWRFLDPRPIIARQDCNAAADDAIGDFSEPYAVPLGTGTTADTQFIVYDSAAVGNAPLAAGNPMIAAYRGQFERAFALASRRPQTFFMNHHPILAFAANPRRPDSPFPGNAGLQAALAPIHPTVLFPPSVQALIAGHVHAFEVVSFSTPQPAQFVAGTSGDWLDAAVPSPFPMSLSPAPGAIVAGIVYSTRFGFMTMEREGAGWVMKAHDRDGAAYTTCTLLEKKADCRQLP